MGKKYFLYTRVSNDDYDKSIDNQIDILLKVAKEKGIDSYIEKPFYEEHQSGSKDKDRPLFDDMMKKLEIDLQESGKNIGKRKYGGILFFKIDRLARNDRDFERLLRLLDAGYEFVSATETIENTPTGRLLFRMLSSFAVYESEKLSNRQSIAKIHNLILERFDSLGGDMIIFGYEINDQKKIQVNIKQSNIISRVYDLFIESNGKIKYKTLFEQLDKEYKGQLTKYLKTRGKTTPENFIGNLIKNETAFKYNGYIEINIGVNDELIKNYLETISDKKYDKYGFSLEGDCKIGGKVKFVYFFDELIIVPDAVYEQKNNISNKKKLNRIFRNETKGLFEDILYVKYENNLHRFLGVPEQKKGKYNNYRKKVGNHLFRISEKKIDDKIINSPNVNKLLKNIPSKLSDIKAILLEQNKVDITKELKKLTATSNLYKGFKDRYFWLMETIDENTIVNTKLFKKYSTLEQQVADAIHSIEQNSIHQIDMYLDITNVQNLINQSNSMKRLVYLALFEKIVYEPLVNNDFRIILYPFRFLTELLGLPSEIII